MILVTASWCRPCQDLKQWLELTGNGEGLIMVDADDLSTGLPEGVRTIPSLIVDGSLFVGNEEIRPFLSSLNVVEL